MSYVERERSDHGGHPLMLYRFSLGEAQWLYTSADHEVVMEADTYVPVFIQGGRIIRGGDPRRSTLEIEVAAQNAVARVFLPGWIGGLMLVTVYRHHYQDGDFFPVWKGRVTGCRWSGSTATLSCDSAFTLFRRAGLRRHYQPGCPHVVFGPGCGLDPAAYRVQTTVAAVSGNVVDLAGAAPEDGYYTGGMLQFGVDRRLITRHTGARITTLDAVPGLAVGSAVMLLPGCARDPAACERFGNIENFGGLPFLPSKNPFSGDALV
ncbi:MAG: phage BR0599 family protein [Desulfobulbus sp.]|jgi:uncharacterized phage protein (TIGR02218 family)